MFRFSRLLHTSNRIIRQLPNHNLPTSNSSIKSLLLYLYSTKNNDLYKKNIKYINPNTKKGFKFNESNVESLLPKEIISVNTDYKKIIGGYTSENTFIIILKDNNNSKITAAHIDNYTLNPTNFFSDFSTNTDIYITGGKNNYTGVINILEIIKQHNFNLKYANLLTNSLLLYNINNNKIYDEHFQPYIFSKIKHYTRNIRYEVCKNHFTNLNLVT